MPRQPEGPPPTLAQLHSLAHWVWLCCEGKKADGRQCWHQGRVLLVLPEILYGVGASSDRLRLKARCRACGSRGASLRIPSWVDPDTGVEPFPGYS
jgi:hypothetical protein